MMTSMPENYPPKPDSSFRVALVGDVVGKPGMKIACSAGRWLRQKLHLDALVVNAENAADGTGLRAKEFQKLMAAGYDAVTLGDHVYRKREIVDILQSDPRIVRPANFPSQAPGRGWTTIEVRGHSLVIISLLGRVFMRPVDCPFQALDAILAQIPNQPTRPAILIDFHAEATSDKQSLGYFADGRVSAILGTHTHVTTADEQILVGGTAFQCDVGMTGPFASILGREVAPVLATVLTFDPNAFHVATEDLRISATWVDIDRSTGKAMAIGRVQWKEAEIQAMEAEESQLARPL